MNPRSSIFRVRYLRVFIKGQNPKMELRSGSSFRGPQSGPAGKGIWCHGPAGYLWCMLLAFDEDPSLLAERDWAAEQFLGALPLQNATYCHGNAGALELLGMLKKISGYEERVETATQKVLSMLEILQTEKNGKQAWASEDPDVMTPDLWVGFMGPASALGMYLKNAGTALLSEEWLGRVHEISI